MRSLMAFAILGFVMWACEFTSGDSRNVGEIPPANRIESSTPKSTPDKQSVQNELLQLENRMADAAVNGDIVFLTENTTDDFELTGVDGKVQSKNAALADVKKEKNIKSWTITEPDLLSFSEDSAVLKFTLNLALKTGQSGKARVTDSFVKKNGRWLIKSEQQTLIR